MLNGIFVHANFEAFFQSTRTTLITMRFIHNTLALRFCFAHIITRSTYWTLEETSTSVTCKYPIVFARTMIAAHFAWHIIQNTTCKFQLKKKRKQKKKWWTVRFYLWKIMRDIHLKSFRVKKKKTKEIFIINRSWSYNFLSVQPLNILFLSNRFN